MARTNVHASMAVCLRNGLAVLAAGVLVVSAASAGEGLLVGRPRDVTPGLAEGDQRWPAVAFGGGLYLVVWQEGEAMAGVKDTNILAARVSPDGKPLDPKGFVVCSAKGYQAYPAVAFDGRNFLVAWQDYRGGKDWDLYAARVAPQGKLLDPRGIAIAAVRGNQAHPTIASDGKRCLVVWSDLRPQQDHREGYALYCTFVQDGRPGDASGRELVSHYDPRRRRARSFLTPIARYDGQGFVLAAQAHPSGWSHGGAYLLRVSADGTPQPLRGGFLGECYALATDPAARRALLWSNCKTEHGHAQTRYLCSVITPEKELYQLALGLQRFFQPVNELWCAAVYDGKNFVAVVEQCPNYTGSREGRHGPVEVDLIATRVDPQTGQPLDTGAQEVPARACRDPRPYGKDKALLAKARPGIKVAAEAGVRERHPAMASAGNGRSLLVYSRHAGAGNYKIHAIPLSE